MARGNINAVFLLSPVTSVNVGNAPDSREPNRRGVTPGIDAAAVPVMRFPEIPPLARCLPAKGFAWSVWSFSCATVCATALLSIEAGAATINITPADNFVKIEAAQPGDEVVIAPGTYRFRVHLTALGTRSNPIKIRALDPNNKPVWDMSASLVENAAGSYTAGDRGRGGWQISGGANYHISGLVFTGCHNASKNCAGIRYYNGATGIYVSDCIFRGNDNGVTGGTGDSDAVFEFCEFDSNGNVTATAFTHNLYIYGGTFALRYSYVHDSLQGQNFHIRAHDSYLEYNWFARAKSYEGDLMTDDDFAGNGPFFQTMLLRGNIFIQNTTPANHSQVLVLYNDNGVPNVSMAMQVIQNTYVGNGIPGNGAAAAFVHLSNADATPMSAVVSNNIIFGTTLPVLIEDPVNGSVQGANNWLKTGVAPAGLSNSVFSALPGFQNAAVLDFTLAPGSANIGLAGVLASGLIPTREYFQNQAVARAFRPRAVARDIGALESTTTGGGVGPSGAPPLPGLAVQLSGGNVLLSWPLTAPEFVLQQESALDGSTVWSEVPGAYVNSPADFSLALPQPSAKRFYRLARP